MTLRRPVAALLAVAGIVVPAGAAHGARLTAALSADQVLPAVPAGVPFAAAATFHGTLTRARHLTWRLQSSGTTGPVTAARIHLGGRRADGPAVLTLCAPCATRTRGTVARVTPRVAAALRTGRAYVEIATAANPAAELRGAVVIAIRTALRQLPDHPHRTETRGMRVLTGLLDGGHLDWDLVLQGIASPVTRAEIREGDATVRVLCAPCGGIRSGTWRLRRGHEQALRRGDLKLWIATAADRTGYATGRILID
ncbi:MAG: CHRD domain-containing protein [Thermoleophilia bacterium]|nr:CHRD domain-containing protein [Thermoleophilia bacterium]